MVISTANTYAQIGETWIYKANNSVNGSLCAKKHPYECCSSNNILAPISPQWLWKEKDCLNKKRVFSLVSNYPQKQYIVIEEDDFKNKKLITPHYTYGSFNVGVLLARDNKQYLYFDIMYGAYTNIYSTRITTIPIGIRGGFGVIADNNSSLALKSEVLIGYYLRRIKTFVSVNAGIAKTENLNKGAFFPYISAGLSKLLINGRNIPNQG